MKILITSFIIIVIIIVGWMFLFDEIEQDCNSFISSLNSLDQKIQSNDWKEAQQTFYDIDEKWSQLRQFWSILIHHHEIDNIDLSVAKAKQYIKSKDPSLSLGEMQTLKQLFSIVKENEALTLNNIL